ncbi:MAG: aminotransferase class IV [Hyphomicrobiales bacterium]|nr:aminotransferase class IV [Hyphomicrobiales bacterium]MCC7480480.1 aminotransferase class IV [Hyphomicrobiales bacterium]HQX84607.1 aminotransferase class IV [Aestuariivirga sp.]
MSVVWFNGEFVAGTLMLDPHDRGFLLGDGVFETVAVINRRPLWLDEHVQRMAHAAVELGIAFSAERTFSGLTEVLKKSEAPCEVLRITLSRGKAARGLAGDGASPGLLITLDEFSVKNLFQPCRLKVSQVRRNEFAPSSRLKTLSYIDGIAAAREVAGEADDALMLNASGHVASATVANIFAMQGDELATPSLDQGVLSGITRRILLEHAKELGLKPVERVVPLEDLVRADAVFLCNSLRFIRPVTTLNGEPLGKGSLDRLIEELGGLAKKQCGTDPRTLM